MQVIYVEGEEGRSYPRIREVPGEGEQFKEISYEKGNLIPIELRCEDVVLVSVTDAAGENGIGEAAPGVRTYIKGKAVVRDPQGVAHKLSFFGDPGRYDRVQVFIVPSTDEHTTLRGLSPSIVWSDEGDGYFELRVHIQTDKFEGLFAAVRETGSRLWLRVDVGCFSRFFLPAQPSYKDKAVKYLARSTDLENHTEVPKGWLDAPPDHLPKTIVTVWVERPAWLDRSGQDQPPDAPAASTREGPLVVAGNDLGPHLQALSRAVMISAAAITLAVIFS